MGYAGQLYVPNYACITCGRHFSSASNLKHHELTHLPQTVKCYGCPRSFTTYGGMIIHLEAGTCASGINILDLNKSAAVCYQQKKWTVKQFRDDLLNCETFAKGVCPFKCPTCLMPMPKLSSLFMHVASCACEQDSKGAIGKLRRWLKRRHKGGKGKWF